MKWIHKYLSLLVLLVLSVVSILPIMHPDFFPMHDDTQVARVFEMGKMLGNGMFPVRWVPDLGYGYGYPIFNFYAPFAYYVGGLLTLVGINALLATKLMIVFAMLVSGIGMYLLAKEFWGEIGGVVSGLLYVYAPYHALDLYVRGDVAELYAYACIPLLFYGIWMQYKTNNVRFVAVTIFSYAALILSHNLTALMVSPFFFAVVGWLYMLKQQKEKTYAVLLLLAPLTGIVLASFYWLPVFSEMRYTNVLSQIGGQADFRNHFVCLPQLWSSPWLYGGSIPGCVDGLSFRIGKLHIILALLGLIASFFVYKKQQEKALAGWLATLGCLLSIFLLLPQSKFIWEAIPHMSFFQYPWRFLLMISFFTSFLSGAFLLFLPMFLSRRKVLFLALVGVLSMGIVVFNSKIFIPQSYSHKSAADYTSERALKSYASSLSDEYLPPKFVKPTKDMFVTKRFVLRSGTAQIVPIQDYGKDISAHIETTTPVQIGVNVAYFPTMHVTINGMLHEFGVSNRGLVVSLPKGTYNIAVVYRQTLIEQVANGISLLTGGGLIAAAQLYRKKKKRA